MLRLNIQQAHGRRPAIVGNMPIIARRESAFFLHHDDTKRIVIYAKIDACWDTISRSPYIHAEFFNIHR